MEMVPYDGGADWHQVLRDLAPLCSSLSLPLAMRTEDCLPIAVVPPGHQSSIGNELPQGSMSSYGGAFAAADFSSSSALMNLREDESYYDLPMFSPAPGTGGDRYWPNQLPPIPEPAADGATAGLDDALLLPFSDIDLEAFGNAEEHKPMIVPQGPHPPKMMHTNGANNAIVSHHASLDVVHAHQKPMAMEAGIIAALVPPPPPSLPPPRGRRSNGDRSAAPAGKTRLDHIGFDDLRKYFYMPITRAAREMNVGLTVLKKRCRELGVARWPHRKMKSLKSLIVNVQEMGNGMPPAAVQQELVALETYCALMEENPSIELTERTKKLRQACFKESYKRRRAAAVNAIDIDHIYSFAQHHRQLLPPPRPSSDDRHGQSSSFFGY